MDSDAEKTEQPTARKLEDAQKQGQIPQSAEVQTALVLLAGLGALLFTGQQTWNLMLGSAVHVLGHLYDIHLSSSALQGDSVTAVLVVGKCVGPVVIACLVGGLLAGGLQNRFNTCSEALTPNWERLNPVEGLKKVFSFRSAVPTALAAAKLVIIILVSYSAIRLAWYNPIFTSAGSFTRVLTFLAGATVSILTRIVIALFLVAAADYAYQFWQTRHDLMMTKEEVKEEVKNQQGNPKLKVAHRKLFASSMRNMLAKVPQADVVVTNPTHIAVALEYDRRTMKAPKIVAKGMRLNAKRIREIAQAHDVPIVENKPLARLMFKYGRVGGEIPAALYAAVAEVLAWAYRLNRYRYYAKENRVLEQRAGVPL